jgi:hypothetical protein
MLRRQGGGVGGAQKMPWLTALKLNNSFVPQLRALGTRLVHLTVLWVSRSSVEVRTSSPGLAQIWP